MCRNNQLWGLLMISFSIGVLVGLWAEGGFLIRCVCVGLILLGGNMLRRK